MRFPIGLTSAVILGGLMTYWVGTKVSASKQFWVCISCGTLMALSAALFDTRRMKW